MRLFFLSILLFVVAGSLSAQLSTSGRPPIPKLTSPVYDETGTLSAGEADALRQKLLTYEDSTSTQVAIMIINTLSDYPASDFAIEAAQENQFGQSKKNNGALILLVPSNHDWFIATGYGLEPTLTDAKVSRIGREILVPALREGKFYEGLDETIDAIIAATKGEFVADKENSPESPWGGAFIFVIIFFVILIFARTLFGAGGKRTVIGRSGSKSGCGGGLMQALFWSSLINSGRNRGSGSWGGFGGGGFGGGGGGWSGGGGSFGGGGAGGKW